MNGHRFDYDRVYSRLWDGHMAASPVARRCRYCGLVEIRSVTAGAEFVPLNAASGACRATEARPMPAEGGEM